MGIFHSPIKLIGILINRKNISKYTQKSADWFTSARGKQEYLSTSTLPQKVEFFYEYLLSIAMYKENKDALYKIAFVMADSMVDSNLEFGGISNVVNPALNPLVAYIKCESLFENTSTSNFGALYASELICALHKEKHPNNYYYSSRKPYTRLTQINADGTFSDMYKIEREIIWAFCTDTKDKTNIGPFSYLIGEEDEDDSKDKIEGFFAKEYN